ncbi:MAG: hypothetical protein COS34_08520 [Lysobacterales bacterium CG02_land_8_20_14_3_00_62_12]|nr:MAG: hypothetical protein COS34_08520 [Xanthomonadales bacterium CG02_land_8_20_14_3_00_62_12]
MAPVSAARFMVLNYRGIAARPPCAVWIGWVRRWQPALVADGEGIGPVGQARQPAQSPNPVTLCTTLPTGNRPASCHLCGLATP